MDAYYGKGIPPELLTVEFFSDVNAISDRTVVNVIMDGTLASAFANNLLASFREAFHGVWVKPLMVEDQKFINVLVSNWPVAGSNPWNGRGIIYHDDKNTADRDWIRLLWRRAKS